jgi:hypothetical protein
VYFLHALRRPSCYVPAVDHATVRKILEKVISSPASINLPEFDEAIRWVERRGTTRQLDRGTDRDVYSTQFEAAAVEMRVLRQLLAHGWFSATAESAHRVLTLLGREISLPGMDRREVSPRSPESREISPRGPEGRREVSPRSPESREISPRGPEGRREVSPRSPESREISPRGPEGRREVSPRSPESREIPPRGPEGRREVSPRSPESREISPRGPEGRREISPRNPENREISPRGMETSIGTKRPEGGRTNLRQATPRGEPIPKLFLRFVISFTGLLLFAASLALVAWWVMSPPPP